MDNIISFYMQKMNLHKATFALIEHHDAMVAIIYKVFLPDGTTFILKICPRAEDYWREVYFLKLLSKQLPIPNIIQLEPPSTTHGGALLMECLPGSTLKKIELTDKLAYEIGRCLACIHQNKVNQYGDLTQSHSLSDNACIPFMHKFEESFSECQHHLPQILLEKAYRYYETHVHLLASIDGPCIIHRDFRPGNMMVYQGQLTDIIDWASARASFAEEDFCPLELGEWSNNSKRKKSFLAGYASIRPIPAYHSVMPLLRINRAFATIGFTIKKGTWKNTHALLYQSNLKYLKKYFQ